MQRVSTKEIRDFILENLDTHESDISAMISEKFVISRQAANRHIRNLVQSGALEASGGRRNRRYRLKPLLTKTFTFKLENDLKEDRIWAKDIRNLLTSFAGTNAYDILHYGCSEICNNAIDHSEGNIIKVVIMTDAKNISLRIDDDGVGIFNKIQHFLNLDDPRQSLLELAKGKFTSDPDRHTGEGIFFTCRMFDWFSINSGSLAFIRYENDDWLIENREKKINGTSVIMVIRRNTERTTKSIFDKFADEASDFGFTRTHVPVNLALYEGEKLISRSQARRVLVRVDRFREVMLDFKDVIDIGPAFADEIFRVFANSHPNIKLRWINSNSDVEKMINRALAANGVTRE